MLTTFWNGPALLELGPQRDQFVLEHPLPQSTLNEKAKVIIVDRLGEKIVGPEPHRLNRLVDAAVSGRHDHRHVELVGVNFTKQFHSTKMRHPQIGDGDAIRTLFQHLQRVGAVRRQVDGNTQGKL